MLTPHDSRARRRAEDRSLTRESSGASTGRLILSRWGTDSMVTGDMSTHARAPTLSPAPSIAAVPLAS